MKKISKELDSRIIKFIENNPIEMDYGHDNYLSTEQIEQIISSEDGIFEVENEIYDYNIEHIFHLEDYFISDVLFPEFENDLEEFLEKTSEENQDQIKEFLDENYREYIIVDTNIDQLLSNTPDILCSLKVYSNYDCQTSVDDINTPENYTSEVWSRIKNGVLKSDYLKEFYNSYTASLFMFTFKTDIRSYIELKKEYLKASKVIIPKNTQYGFFSDFNGSGSMFENTTYRKSTLTLKEDNYDHIDLEVEIGGSYGFQAVYGSDDFINDGSVKFI